MFFPLRGIGSLLLDGVSFASIPYDIDLTASGPGIFEYTLPDTFYLDPDTVYQLRLEDGRLCSLMFTYGYHGPQGQCYRFFLIDPEELNSIPERT